MNYEEHLTQYIQPMTEAIIKKILHKYNVDFMTILPPQKGYRNTSYAVVTSDETKLNLILYKSEAGILSKIEAADRVSNHLALHSLPVRRVVYDKTVKLTAGNFLQYSRLYNFLPGQTIPWEAYSKNHLKLLGKALSIVHQGLGDLVRGNLPSVTDEYAAINQTMSDYFAALGVQDALANKLHLVIDGGVFEKQKHLLAASQSLSGQQALHMDFVRDNILFSSHKTDTNPDLLLGDVSISGILDFEKAAWGPPAFDVARTLAFLLVDCKYKTSPAIRKYFLGSGYIKRGPKPFLKPIVAEHESKKDIFENLVTLFLIYDFYKFLKHNPYEFLESNEHFIRTRDILHSRHILAKID